MGRPRTTAVLLPLCLLLTTCSEQDPCFRLETPEDYLACPDLCGDEAPTSIQCHSVVPSFPSGVFRCDTDLLGERTDPIDPEDPRFSGYWIMGESSPGFVEIVGLPVRGVPTTRPVGQLRSTDEVPALPCSKMSLYYRYFTGSGRCVIEIGSVMTWDFLPRADAAFAINFERSSMIMKRNSHCSTYSSLILEPGYAWKETGEIYKRSGSRCVNGSGDDDDDDAGIDIPPNFCVEDGWCNPACDNDPDCECHDDGVCDPITCPGDADCKCLEDGTCDAECAYDPDCRCVEDGVCDPSCGDEDVDCLCIRDDYCDCDCILTDPDCGCFPDGVCSVICGWADEDCLCVEEGACNPDCEDGDPDCEESE